MVWGFTWIWTEMKILLCLKVRDIYLKIEGFAYLHFSAFAGSFLNLIFCNLSLNFSEGIYYTERVFINGNIEY